MSDKIGRSKTMIFTILFYSVFTCVTAFAQEPWHMVALRFLVFAAGTFCLFFLAGKEALRIFA